MTWTKQHSKNAVAAKARIRMERANLPIADDPEWKTYTSKRLTPDFTINIRSRSGGRVQITATRFGKQFITDDGLKSSRAIGRGIEMLLRHCVP
jgi:hypothetical protein